MLQKPEYGPTPIDKPAGEVGGGGGGVFRGFQVTGMIEGFFWVAKFGKYFLGWYELI